MSGHTGNDVQASCIGYTKSKTSITSLLKDVNEIRELQWQGVGFTYPNIRISVDFFPATNGCQDKAEVVFEVYSEEKSSDQASTIAGAIYTAYHRKPFSYLGVNFFSVIATNIAKPERTMYGWKSSVTVAMILA